MVLVYRPVIPVCRPNKLRRIPNSEGEITGYRDTDLFGVSDSSYSVVLAYDKNDLGMRLSYSWREGFLANYEAALFANPLEMRRKSEASMDFQLSYKLTEQFEITLDGTNLTNELYQSYYGNDATTGNFGHCVIQPYFRLRGALQYVSETLGSTIKTPDFVPVFFLSC